MTQSLRAFFVEVPLGTVFRTHEGLLSSWAFCVVRRVKNESFWCCMARDHSIVRVCEAHVRRCLHSSDAGGVCSRYQMSDFFKTDRMNNVCRGPNRDVVTVDRRKLHNEELHNLYSSPNIIRMFKSRRMRWAGHAARMGETRNAYRILVGKPEGKRPLGRPRRR
jgi:hypothetical protein